MRGERRSGGASANAALTLDRLSKRYGETAAVDDLTLSIEASEILALLGPSGSGKTTTLRLLAGFERPDTGRVLLDERDVTRLGPVHRRFGMVFQHYALFPHLDVGDNVAFGLRSQGVRGTDLADRVAGALRRVDLDGFERRRIGQLSGGQQQRVAVARALAPEPRVLLLDEPLSNLDPSLRERTRRELRALIHRIGITTVLVTHEQEEAFDLGERVAVMRQGRLEQIGTADELYGTPRTRFVAGFVGRSSVLAAVLVGSQPETGVLRVDVEGVEWELDESVLADASGSAGPGPVVVMVRPEGLQFTDPGDGVLNGEVVERRFLGGLALYTVATIGGQSLEVSAPPDAAGVGHRVGLHPARTGLHVFRQVAE